MARERLMDDCGIDFEPSEAEQDAWDEGYAAGVEAGKAEAIDEVKDFAYHLVEKIETLPKEPNGYSKVYDESMMINIVESCLENYLSNMK